MPVTIKRLGPVETVRTTLIGSILLFPLLILFLKSKQTPFYVAILFLLLYWIGMYLIQRLHSGNSIESRESIASTRPKWLIAHLQFGIFVGIVQALTYFFAVIQDPRIEWGVWDAFLYFVLPSFANLMNSILIAVAVGFLVYALDWVVMRMYRMMKPHVQNEQVADVLVEHDSTKVQPLLVDYDAWRAHVFQRWIDEARRNLHSDDEVYAVLIEDSGNFVSRLTGCNVKNECFMLQVERVVIQVVAEDWAFREKVSELLIKGHKLFLASNRPSPLPREENPQVYMERPTYGLDPIYVVTRNGVKLWHINRFENYGSNDFKAIDLQFRDLRKKMLERLMT